MCELIKVGMADLKTCQSPAAVTTLGLGSCVGIALRDPVSGIGGLVHVMLPDSTAFHHAEKLAKFADTGIEELVRQMVERGANRGRIEAKIAGGATMFSFEAKSDMLRVGEKNVAATIEVLNRLRISLLAQDTGGSYGRTVIYYPQNGDLHIRAVGKEEKVI